VAVELYSLTKSFSMAGWRVAFLVGNAEIVAALTKLKSYLDYGTFPTHPDRRHRGHERGARLPEVGQRDLPARRDALCDGLNRIGWNLTPPKGTMFRVGAIPEPYREMGSLEFSPSWCPKPRWRRHPGSGSGPAGGTARAVRLIENEQRIGQARPQPSPSPHQAALTPQSRCTDSRRAQRPEGGYKGIRVFEAQRELPQLDRNARPHARTLGSTVIKTSPVVAAVHEPTVPPAVHADAPTGPVRAWTPADLAHRDGGAKSPSHADAPACSPSSSTWLSPGPCRALRAGGAAAP